MYLPTSSFLLLFSGLSAPFFFFFTFYLSRFSSWSDWTLISSCSPLWDWIRLLRLPSQPDEAVTLHAVLSPPLSRTVTLLLRLLRDVPYLFPGSIDPGSQWRGSGSFTVALISTGGTCVSGIGGLQTGMICRFLRHQLFSQIFSFFCLFLPASPSWCSSWHWMQPDSLPDAHSSDWDIFGFKSLKQIYFPNGKGGVVILAWMLHCKNIKSYQVNLVYFLRNILVHLK